MARTYNIRKYANGHSRKDGRPFMNYSLTIPAHIAEMLPEDLQFQCELNDQGILFRPVQSDEENVELPSWAQQNGQKADNDKTRSKRRSETERR